ncbi:glycerophosphodiester phosphodiesterase [Niveibacterium sp. SC-1]|uniref:glycerophosphodiester phosphodiesterase n=1 Tax=Niveibacterium sp. SC-1 TaxID=3135646 RepID=UPI00311F5636
MSSAWPLPRVVTHRCGGTLAPENTLIGLEFTLAHGVSAVEFDVMLSGEGTPILIHDEDLLRTTGRPGAVAQTPDAEIVQRDAGSWHSARFAGERIPLFADAIERCRALGIVANVEIKPAEGFDAVTGEAAARMAAVGWQGTGGQPLLSSFSPTALQAAMHAAPGLPRALLVDGVPEDFGAAVAAVGGIGLVCNGRKLDAATVARIKAAGLGLGTYTENDPGRARQLLDWGVDSVITDRPDLLAHLA